MRGEHYYDVPSDRPDAGSSPHARGTQHVDRARKLSLGIIPACAGNTPLATRLHGSRRDHPRMRGEHIALTHRYVVGMGSSPHARGTLHRQQQREPVGGIIPACAGNTPSERPARRGSRDHPRMRGEHDKVDYVLTGRLGSSPHARGTLARRRRSARAVGIIPACAGNTS